MTLLDRVHWIDLPTTSDERGVLTAIESEADLPFGIKRVFLVHDVTAPRGGHAHRDTEQLLVAAYGCIEVRVSDGERHREFTLDAPTRGLYTPPMVFIDLRQFSPGAVCLVLASTHYDRGRSLRTWEAFLKAVRE